MGLNFPGLLGPRRRLVQLHDEHAGVSGALVAAGHRPLPEERAPDPGTGRGDSGRDPASRRGPGDVRRGAHHLEPAGHRQRKAQRLELALTGL